MMNCFCGMAFAEWLTDEKPIPANATARDFHHRKRSFLIFFGHFLTPFSTLNLHSVGGFMLQLP